MIIRNLIHNNITKMSKAYIRMLLGKQGKFVSLDNYQSLYPKDVEIFDIGSEQLLYATSQKNFDYNDIVQSSVILNNNIICLHNATCYAYSDVIRLSNGDYYCETRQLPIIGRASDCSDGYVLKLDRWYGQLVEPPQKNIHVKEGIFMSGLFSWNYYHFTYQIVPRLKDLRRVPISVPLLVDKKSQQIPSFKDLLQLCNLQKRQLIVMDDGVGYKVDSLYIVSAQTLCMPNYKPSYPYPHPTTLYRASTLDFLNHMVLDDQESKDSYPKRIFLSRRNASGRRKFNEEECIKCAKEFNVEVVYPEDYSLREQMQMFHNAEVIIGGTGAAFTNLVYCSKDVKVIIFAKYKGLCQIWQTIVEHNGGKMVEISECEWINGGIPTEKLHEEYRVDILLFQSILKKALANDIK